MDHVHMLHVRQWRRCKHCMRSPPCLCLVRATMCANTATIRARLAAMRTHGTTMHCRVAFVHASSALCA
eukprot:352312-Chlamydomonas_euryale.AAC.23